MSARPSTPAAPEPPADPPPVRVLRQFRIVFTALKTQFQQVERRSGLGGAQVWALATIRERPGIGVGELARALSVRQPTASILVKNLVRLGLVEARRASTDRRALNLQIRPEGRSLLRRVPPPHAGLLPVALESMPPETLAELERSLATLIDTLGADERGGTTPLAQISR